MTRALEILDADPSDLPAIDLTTRDLGGGNVDFDPRTFDERYANLGCGLGVVPRRSHRDDPWWATPIGMMAGVLTLLLLLWISTAG